MSVSRPPKSDKGGCDRRPEGQAVSVERVALHVGGAVEANLLAVDRVLNRRQTIKQCLVKYSAKTVPAFNVRFGLLAKTLIFTKTTSFGRYMLYL